MDDFKNIIVPRCGEFEATLVKVVSDVDSTLGDATMYAIQKYITVCRPIFPTPLIKQAARILDGIVTASSNEGKYATLNDAAIALVTSASEKKMFDAAIFERFLEIRYSSCLLFVCCGDCIVLRHTCERRKDLMSMGFTWTMRSISHLLCPCFVHHSLNCCLADRQCKRSIGRRQAFLAWLQILDIQGERNAMLRNNSGRTRSL